MRPVAGVRQLAGSLPHWPGRVETNAVGIENLGHVGGRHDGAGRGLDLEDDIGRKPYRYRRPGGVQLVGRKIIHDPPFVGDEQEVAVGHFTEIVVEHVVPIDRETARRTVGAGAFGMPLSERIAEQVGFGDAPVGKTQKVSVLQRPNMGAAAPEIGNLSLPIESHDERRRAADIFAGWAGNAGKDETRVPLTRLAPGYLYWRKIIGQRVGGEFERTIPIRTCAASVVDPDLYDMCGCRP